MRKKQELTIESNRVFNEDVENLSKQKGGGKSIDALSVVIDLIKQQEKLPDKHRYHKLNGKYKGYSSCHVHNDLCLIWKINKEQGSVTFYRVGSHSEIY